MSIEINISKSYGKLNIFSNFELTLNVGKNYAIVGPTGCGKTTLLNILAGIDKSSTGNIKIPPELSTSYLLQENVILPWRTLKENIQLSLEVQQNIHERDAKIISGYIERFDLQGFEDYYPNSLSGGMKQRAALIRCLI